MESVSKHGCVFCFQGDPSNAIMTLVMLLHALRCAAYNNAGAFASVVVKDAIEIVGFPRRCRLTNLLERMPGSAAH